MKQGKWKLKVKKDFAAAHQLRNYNGKCENMHGHNFGVEVEVEGCKLDPEVEIVMDFKVLKTELADVLETLDHKDLNKIEYFKNRNPSSENLARYVYEEMKKRVETDEIKLIYASVSENESSVATYSEI
ncbi:6-carboxytetrahydropterin synthase QueD [Desulfovibrio gilichinskyi]|uniref:6-carboxy-5,6,7,8-tetrahydropterin synthase n=1 Tax=Desulfovibrio gilichinskyi TaxID=1519643 RepID=A0A1X7EQB2_9BACT|nr:6-carboxytetrahydropterin synthase QueD [Desulfovibrio gilichinskyi]SMF37613.1 6-pyruvoyltetrahydropterin/6-carboxytetrahydropterin synthase [Desulfovibrio gilichinskyi]